MRWLLVIGCLLLLAPSAAGASRTLAWQDPAGDDHGPGAYIYPTSEVYRPGTFDLREVTVRARGANVEFKVRFEAPLDDPWDSRSSGGHGFCLQQIHLYLDTDGQKDSGLSSTLAGTGASFAPGSGWERVVVLSPESRKRAKRLVSEAAGNWARRVVLPRRIRVKGDTLVATVRRSDLGGRPSPKWRLQALVLAADPYASPGTMNVQVVNELPGAHRFGGGTDSSCDPNVIDALVPADVTQDAILSYRCPWRDGGGQPALLPLVAP